MSLIKHTDSIVVSGDSGLADLLYTIGSKYSNKFVAGENSNTFFFDGCKIYVSNSIISPKNGDTTLFSITSGFQTNNTYTVVSSFSDTFFFFELYWSNGGRKTYIAFISQNGRKFVGAINAYSEPRVDSMSFGDIVSGVDASYKVRRLFSDVTLPSPSILFADTSILSNNSGTDFIEIEELQSCSNVSLYSTVSINNKNYLVVGYNILIEITET